MHDITIIVRLWKASVIQAMEYRMSFVFAIFANFMDFIFGLLQYVVFFTAAKNVAGWDANEVLALYAVFMSIFALQFIFLYPNLVAMGEMVNTGTLDLLLTRPVSSQLVLSFRKVSFEEFGSLTTSLFLMIWLTLNGTIILSMENIFYFGVLFFCSASLTYSMFVIFLSLTVKLEKLDNMANLMWSIFSLCRYPAEIYPRWLRSIFYSIFPVAFISTAPAAALTGRLQQELIASAIIIAVISLLLSRISWKMALKAYTSAGG